MITHGFSEDRGGWFGYRRAHQRDRWAYDRDPLRTGSQVRRGNADWKRSRVSNFVGQSLVLCGAMTTPINILANTFGAGPNFCRTSNLPFCLAGDAQRPVCFAKPRHA